MRRALLLYHSCRVWDADLWYDSLMYGWVMSRQCVAVWCSALQCVAVRCSALQCVAVCCSALQCVAVHRWVVSCVRISHATTIVHRSKRALCRRKLAQNFSQKNTYQKTCIARMTHSCRSVSCCLCTRDVFPAQIYVTGLPCLEPTWKDSLAESKSTRDRTHVSSNWGFQQSYDTICFWVIKAHPARTRDTANTVHTRDRTHLSRTNVTWLTCQERIYMWQDTLV